MKNLLIVCLSVCLATSSLFSQRLFTPLVANEQTLPSSTQTILNGYRSLEGAEDVRRVRFDGFKPMVRPESLIIDVGDVFEEHQGVKMHYTIQNAYDDGNSKSWYGTGPAVKPAANHPAPAIDLGEFFLSVDDGVFTGYYEINEYFYQIMPLRAKEKEYVIVKFAPKNGAGVCGNSESPDDHQPGKHQESSDLKNIGPCFARANVSVLVVFTAAADAAHPDIRNHSRLAFNQLRQALVNTGVARSRMGVSLIGIEQTMEVETFDPTADLIAFNTNLLPLRNARNADIVMIITDNVYTRIAGQASTVQINPDLYTAVVEHGDAIDAKTFAHEFGHVAGARHENDDTAIDFERGYAFATGFWPFLKRRGTVLATRAGITTRPGVNAGERRITQFSNPDKRYKGSRTGENGEHDNHDWFEDNGITLAAYRPNPNDRLSVQIDVPRTSTGTLCPTTETFISSTATCPTGNIRYTWEVSTNFIDFTVVSSSASVFLDDVPLFSPSFRVLRLTVMDDEETATTTAFLNYDPFACDGGLFRSAGSNEMATVQNLQISRNLDDLAPSVIYPNPLPSGGKSSLQVEVGSLFGGERQLSLSLIGPLGKAYDLGNHCIKGAIITIDPIDLANPRPGVHTLVLRSLSTDASEVVRCVIAR